MLIINYLYFVYWLLINNIENCWKKMLELDKYWSKIDFKFEVVKGNAIRKYYHYTSYYRESGSLGNSCMKYDVCQDYLGLYTHNKDICSLLIATDNRDRLIGRALL